MLDIAAYLVYFVFLFYASITDWRTLRISNHLVIAIMFDWLVWHVLRDLLPRFVDANLLLPELNISAANGALAAVAFGAGLTLITLAYEALTHKHAMGGGDIKLMAASALFLGLQQSMIALMIACISSVIIAPLYKHFAQAHQQSQDTNSSLGSQNNAEVSSPAKDFVVVTPAGMPFAPAIALGSIMSLLLF